MTYLDLIRDAEYKLEHNKITLVEYNKMIEPLRLEIPKRGKWNVFDAQNYCITYICSECGRLVTVYHEFGKPKDVIEGFPFCHCGADMREVNADADSDCMD